MAGGTWRALRRTLFRRKPYEPRLAEDTNFKRCLTRWDATALGVGSTLGVGVYLLTGHVALRMAGPSIVLSFIIAAFAAMMAGLCYGEFASRIPRAGAAYTYTYVALGEVVAFIIGWGNIVEGLFGAASLARGVSMHMDHIVNYSMSSWFQSVAPLHHEFIAPHFDFFACAVVLVVGVLLMFGTRGAVTVNNIFVLFSMAVAVLVVAAGSFAADSKHWSIPPQEVPTGFGVGGFFPYGIWGTFTGAAVCFYAFVGFDSVCAAGEEVRDPRRVIPITIVLVILGLLVINVSIAIIVTMIVPYYVQNTFNAVAAVFTFLEWEWARWIVSIGTLFALYAGVFGAMFPLPRILYSMSSDGFFISLFSKLTRRQSPAWATAFATVIIATLAGLFELKSLILMMCIGTLFSYTIISISVIVLRYRSDYTPGQPKYFKQIIGLGKFPTLASARVIYVCLVLFIASCIAIAVLSTSLVYPVIPIGVLHGVAFVLMIVMSLQPQIKEETRFKTPLVPLVPCLSIYANIHLMVFINVQTWIRAGIWLAAGIITYTCSLCCKRREKTETNSNTTNLARVNQNGKPAIQIIVESPTPPDTITHIKEGDIQTEEEIQKEIKDKVVRSYVPEIQKTEEITIHQAYIENNEEKEAKIIDLLDQVLQAEEDSYEEMIILKEQNNDEVVSSEKGNLEHRKSLSELSDAGSDASLGNHGLSKYDVIAQVHREDLPKVYEEEEKSYKEDQDEILEENYMDDHENVTAFNDSETNSRTDESGYSDTIDRNVLCESLEESKEEIPHIPEPPPMDENYFKNVNFKKSYTIASKHARSSSNDDVAEENKPRDSVTSNNSLGDGNITFGSDRQIHFMSKLNNIFQNKITSNSSDEDEPRKRSHSTGNVVENNDFSINRERSPLFEALKSEIIAKDAAQNLRPVGVQAVESEDKTETSKEDVETKEESVDEDNSLSKADLKSKLENIFAAGGPQLLKPRLMKSNPPTPEESYQTDASSTESIPKLPKMDKNDTLKRQRDKFGEVLNSFKLSFNKDDDV